MVLALCTAFALSQAFRTVAAIMAAPLQADFGLSAQPLGIFAGAFHFAFGALQLFMGIGIDLHGVRRTVLAAFPLAIAGAVLSALAPNFGWLVLGQVLIGIGCAPAFLVCTVFIARHFPAAALRRRVGADARHRRLGHAGRPARRSRGWSRPARGAWASAVLARRGAGLVRDRLAGCANRRRRRRDGAAARIDARSLAPLRRPVHAAPHAGHRGAGAVTYASFITLRGLWLGPLLMERYQFSLVQSGNVALIVSAISLVRSAAVRPAGSGRRHAARLADRLHAAAGRAVRRARR